MKRVRPSQPRRIEPRRGAPAGGDIDRSFASLRAFVQPYTAGPYAEGSYEASIPVDAAMVAALAPRWRAEFAAAR